jgi:hypothetical protein
VQMDDAGRTRKVLREEVLPVLTETNTLAKKLLAEAALLLSSFRDTLTLRILLSRLDRMHLAIGLPERLLGGVDETRVRRAENP